MSSKKYSKRNILAKAKKIQTVLLKIYGGHKPIRSNPLDELIVTILSQNTNDLNRDRAFKELKNKYKSWRSVAKANPNELARTIRIGGLANIKSKRIIKILGEIEQKGNGLKLNYLNNLNSTVAWEKLQEFNGVGPKTAACVMLFSFGRDIMPIDTHIFRVGKRLGIIPEYLNVDKAHIWFNELDLPLNLLDLHLNLIEHGRKICRPRNPKCQLCNLTELCDYYKAAIF